MGPCLVPPFTYDLAAQRCSLRSFKCLLMYTNCCQKLVAEEPGLTTGTAADQKQEKTDLGLAKLGPW